MSEINERKSCECEICQGACKFYPGWFLPEEIELAASFLNMTKQDFFNKYLGVNWWVGESPIFVLAPAITTMETGEEYPGDPRGTCVFFQDNKCAIHEVKPHECKRYYHGEDKWGIDIRHKFVSSEWSKKQSQNEIINLLGREPEVEYFDGFCLFGVS